MKKFLFVASLLLVSHGCFAEFNLRHMIFGQTPAEKFADHLAKVLDLTETERTWSLNQIMKIDKHCSAYPKGSDERKKCLIVCVGFLMVPLLTVKAEHDQAQVHEREARSARLQTPESETALIEFINS
jgi:hypothetical protein